MILQAIFALGLLGGVWAQMPTSSCQDLDTQACQLFQKAKPDLCSDPAFANGTCRRFCGMCPLECFSCPYPVMDPTDCNSTEICGLNTSCSTKHLRAIDGHHEYIMTCEKREICDGFSFGFAFGKRDLLELGELRQGDLDRYQRDVSLSCCDTDFCNMPSMTTTTMGPTTTKQVTSTSACHRDIVFVIDDSGSVGSTNFKHAVDFVRQVVNHLNIGPTDAHVAVLEYSSHPQVNWYLNQHTDKTSILNRLNQLNFNGGSTKTGEALKSVRQELLDLGNGARSTAANVVVVLTDGQSTDKSDTIHQANLLHTISKHVVSIVIGQGTDLTELNAIATDSNHIFDLRHYSALPTIVQQLLNLICN